MNMIQKNRKTITLISIFTVEDSSNQQRLIELHKDFVKQTLNKHHGFISAYIHSSLDGTKVVSYTQWENRDAIEKILNDPKVIIHMNDIDQIAKVDRGLYDIAFVGE
jgi:quinol monooxygenase YgiN